LPNLGGNRPKERIGGAEPRGRICGTKDSICGKHEFMVPISSGPFDHGAILGLVALIGFVTAAWILRRRYPLASFGIFAFLLLLAPTSSFIPAQDAFAEHRLYLPFLGLILFHTSRKDESPFAGTTSILAAARAPQHRLDRGVTNPSELSSQPVQSKAWQRAILASPTLRNHS
jgi:hypothetical protein